MATETLERPKAMIVAPFGVEADHPRNNDLVIQAIPGCRLRGKMKTIVQAVTGEISSPQVAGHSVPELPGMQLHINPADLSYVITDPLNDDPDAMRRLSQFLQATTGTRADQNLRGVPTKKGKLDVHRMKSLCREVCDLLDEGHFKMVKGAQPKRDDVEDLPGHFLLNPGARTQNQQPVFEKDYEEWVDRLTRSGG